MPKRRWFPNTTDNEPPDRMTPDRPELIEEVNNLNPYRGTEDHGVPNKEKAGPYPDYTGHDAYLDNNSAIKWEDEKPGIDPVPVVIVSQGQKELRRWYTNLAMARTDTQLVLGRNEARQTARIKNIGNVPVLLGPENAVGNGVGYPLAPGEEFTTNSEAEVWGVTNPGAETGGWVQLMPATIVNGQVNLFGSKFATRNFTAGRFYLKVNSVSGTTPKVELDIYAVGPDSTGAQTIPGTVISAGQTLSVVSGRADQVINPLLDQYIVPCLNGSGGSADQSTVAEAWGYFTPDTTSTDSISLLRIYQEITVKE